MNTSAGMMGFSPGQIRLSSLKQAIRQHLIPLSDISLFLANR
ncbi:hypothetical protein CSC30_2232 [Pseudomonas aeruginosa]|nr:hypothetical protein CSC30_2232 [Pseudomonas aeruginosa]